MYLQYNTKRKHHPFMEGIIYCYYCYEYIYNQKESLKQRTQKFADHWSVAVDINHDQ